MVFIVIQAETPNANQNPRRAITKGNNKSIGSVGSTYQNVYQPPSHKFRVACSDLKDDEKIYQLFYEILRYLIFLYLVLLITYGQREHDIYRVNSSLMK